MTQDVLLDRSVIHTPEKSGEDPDIAIAKSRLETLQAEGWFEGYTTERMTPNQAERYLRFDNQHFFDRYRDGFIPDDHQPAELDIPTIRDAMRDEYVQGVFDRDGTLVATLWAHIDEEASNLKVVNMAVAKRHRAQTLGKYMLGTAEAIARERGMRSLSLDVDPLNTSAIKLYFRQGYQGVQVTDANDPEVQAFGIQHFVGMRKDLQPPARSPLYDREQWVSAGNDAMIEKLFTGPGSYVVTEIRGNAHSEDARNNMLRFERLYKPGMFSQVLRSMLRRR
jgi:ribosomal protein S18 acetylase RimI-like enzyme